MTFKYKVTHDHNVYQCQTKKEVNQYLKENNVDNNYCILCNNKIIIDTRMNPFKA